MTEIFMLKLTKEELWALSENYTAAFTDPDERSPIEVVVSEKLLKISLRAPHEQPCPECTIRHDAQVKLADLLAEQKNENKILRGRLKRLSPALSNGEL
jgi:hypothetical protein